MTTYGHRSAESYLRDILERLSGTLTVSGGGGAGGDASAANQLTEIARLDSLLTELGQKLEAADIAGYALDTSLQSILTELGQKLEPADIAGLATQATLASILTELGQKLEAVDIAGYALDSSLQSILTELGQKLEPADIAGLATQATLASILTELGQKLEAADIVGYALDATLQSILTELGQKTEPANTQIVSVLSQIGAANALPTRTTVTATATTIVAARASRRGALVLNNGSNRCDIWFVSADKAYGAADTFPLSPGQSFPVGTIAIVRGICNTALSTEIDVIEVYE